MNPRLKTRRFSILWYLLPATMLVAMTSARAADGGPGPDGSTLKQLVEDLADGQLDDWSLEAAFLIAGGLENRAELHEYEQRLNKLLSRLVDDPAAEAGKDQDEVRGKSRAERLFARLHTQLLTGRYLADCTQLHRVLEAGDYNCVTATFLYHALCRRERLPCGIICTPAHVFCRVGGGDGEESPDSDVDVQTTCAAWFQIARDPALLAIARLQNPCLQHAPQRQRELTELQLLGKVFYNRGLAELNGKRYAEAARLFRVSLQLDTSDESARTNLLATFNEWALELVERQAFAEAADCLERGRRWNPTYKPYQVNDLYIHQKWAQWLCQQGKFEEAIALLEAGRQRRPDAELFQNGPAAIRRLSQRKSASPPPLAPVDS